jgi:hypothetical protein
MAMHAADPARVPGAAPARRRVLAAIAAAPLAACAMRTDAPATFSAEALALALARRPVVLLGEVHDNPLQHRVRAEALRLTWRRARARRSRSSSSTVSSSQRSIRRGATPPAARRRRAPSD